MPRTRTAKKLLEEIPYHERAKVSRFLTFLKKEGAYRKYVTACEQQNDRLPESVRSSSPIGGAFAWQATPEKHDYWSDLDQRWKEERDK